MVTFSWIVIALLIATIIYIWRRWLFRCKKCESHHRPEEVAPYSDQLLIAISSTMCVAVIIVYFLIAHAVPGIVEKVGEVGDFIGGLINPLLSFAAFIVLLRTTTIQNRIVKKQLDSQEMLTFREEFYSLRDNMLKLSDRMGRSDNGYVIDLYDEIQAARSMLSEQFNAGPAYEANAREIIIGLIRNKDFDRFALAVRRAMKQVLNSSPKEIFDHAIVIRDSMTLYERIVFLNWIYYFWDGEARKWFVGTWSDNGKWLSYDFTGGMDPSDLISDEVYNYFNQELPKNK